MGDDIIILLHAHIYIVGPMVCYICNHQIKICQHFLLPYYCSIYGYMHVPYRLIHLLLLIITMKVCTILLLPNKFSSTHLIIDSCSMRENLIYMHIHCNNLYPCMQICIFCMLNIPSLDYIHTMSYFKLVQTSMIIIFNIHYFF